MKFKKGDKVRVIRRYDLWLEVGQVYTIINNPENGIISVDTPSGAGGFLISEGYFELLQPAVPVFDRYQVFNGNTFITGYKTFEEADTRARGLAESGKIVTVKGVTKDKLIATYQRPNNPVEVIFADAS